MTHLSGNTEMKEEKMVHPGARQGSLPAGFADAQTEGQGQDDKLASAIADVLIWLLLSAAGFGMIFVLHAVGLRLGLDIDPLNGATVFRMAVFAAGITAVSLATGKLSRVAQYAALGGLLLVVIGVA